MSKEDDLNESVLRLSNELSAREQQLFKLDNEVIERQTDLKNINGVIATNRSIANSEERKFAATKQRMIEEINSLQLQIEMLTKQAVDTETYTNEQKELIRVAWLDVKRAQNRTNSRNGTSVFNDLS